MRIFHNTRTLALIAVLAFPVITTQAANAGTASATMSVSASIAGACTVSASALSFGAYTSSSASTSSSTIQVTCSNGTNAVASLNQGSNNNRASTYGTRALNNGANYLGYEIYTDSAYATSWNTTNTQSLSSTGSVVNLTAYGRIPSGQNPATGSYNDTVTISVAF